MATMTYQRDDAGKWWGVDYYKALRDQRMIRPAEHPKAVEVTDPELLGYLALAALIPEGRYLNTEFYRWSTAGHDAVVVVRDMMNLKE